MILEGILSVMNFESLGIMLVGTVVGILFGSVPGLTTTMGVALSLPMTFAMTPVNGLSFLIAIYIGGTSGGLITSILLGIPGTPAAVATTFDGFPMAKNGQAAKALGTGVLVSGIGTLASTGVLIALAPTLAEVALAFGPFEMFAVVLFAMTLITTLVGDNVVKGLMMAIMGIALSLVGFAPIGGAQRFMFGIHELAAGFNMLPVMMGLFAISEILKMAQEGLAATKAVEAAHIKIRGFGISLKEFKGQILNMIRSCAIGTGIGLLPGIGSATSNVVAYSIAKTQSKHPQKFGTGIVDGVVASESSNSATLGSAMIPLLVFGIPADTVTAMMLGGLMIHGITPGPMLFQTNAVLVFGIYSAFIICAIFLVIVMLGGMNVFIKLLVVPKHILFPIILILCVVGAFGTNFRMFDVWTALFFGFAGFFLSKHKFPQAPFIMGFVLGPILEENLLRGLMFTSGNFFGFFRSPIASAFMFISFASVTWTLVKAFIKRRKLKSA